MTFYDVVRQVLDLLQRQGRVSSRALKREFGIDDEFIEDLKEERSMPMNLQYRQMTEGLYGSVTRTQP